MELNSDLVAIQGILVGLIKDTGEFTKINYKGGNEERILDIMMEIQKFLSEKHYLKNTKINKVFVKQIEDIVMFLTINTHFKHDLVLEGYSHLINIMPQLSKCLLSNIVYGLDLCQCLCGVMKRLPVEITVELLDEMVICLKKSEPQVHLNYAYLFLSTSSDILSTTALTKKNEDHIDNLVQVTNIILHNLTGLYCDQMKTWKTAKIYKHMGFSLLKLFDLLLNCDKDNILIQQFIENIVRTSCSLVKNVTIDVFCTWAEIEEDEETLQNIIAVKAYLVLEVYQKYKPAEELIGMLSTIARKPKSLAEQIQIADMETMIKKIEKQDSEQKLWFQALLKTQILRDKKAIKCVKTWAHLSTPENVNRILNLSVNSNDEGVKELVIKCASVLNKDQLILILTRYFFQNGFQNILNQNVEPQLVLLFNKIGEKSCPDDEFVKDIALLLLQNPKSVFKFIYKECVKNSYYTATLKECFREIKEISNMEKIGLNIFNEVFKDAILDDQNIKNFTTLINTLLDINYFNNDIILNKIILEPLKDNYEKEILQGINCNLRLLNAINITIEIKEGSKEILQVLLKVMNTQRCKFLEFNPIKQDNVNIVCEVIKNKCDCNLNTAYKVESIEGADNFVFYYENMLSNETIHSFLFHMYDQFNIENYAECVTKLIQILSRCTSNEWSTICSEILKKCCYAKTVELLTDVLLLIGQVVESQKGANEDILTPVDNALKYYMHNYGSVLQHIIQIENNIEVESCVANNICRLLRKFPERSKLEQGMILINIIPTRCLRSLANDKDFVHQMVAIDNTELCKLLAKKMIT